MDTLIGGVLCILAGVFVGVFLLPLKLSRRWAWENSWLIGAAVMFLVLPFAEALLFIPAVPAVLREAGARNVSFSFIAGVVQGTASLVLTYGVILMGLSLGYSVMISMIVVFGTMVPLFFRHREQLISTGGVTLIAGVCIIIAGAIMAGVAGRQRESLSNKVLNYRHDRDVSLGLMFFVSIYVGITASLNYIILEFQSTITQNATTQYGVPRSLAPVVVLLPWYLGVFVLNLVYCIAKMAKDGTLENYFKRVPGLGREYLLAISIGLLWYLGQGVLYLAGFQRLGVLGVPVGAALFMASTIVSSNASGVITKEWDGVPKPIANLMFTAVVILLLGIVVIGVGNAL